MGFDRLILPTYAELASEWRALRNRGPGDLRVREVACVGAPRTLLIAECGAAGRPVVALAAGVHGDEPAAPWALLSLARDGLLDDFFAYRMWPCTNPSGYEAGTRANAEGDDINRSFGRGGTTPEARAIVTANRDRTFELSFDLHEDYEASGFYCYEPARDGEDFGLGLEAIDALDAAGLPVEELHDAFEVGFPPETHFMRSLERGRVVADGKAELAYFPETPYNMYLFRRAAKRALTFESPSSARFEDRIAMHRTAVVAALAALRHALDG